MLAELRHVELPAGSSPLDATQVEERFKSLFTPSTLSGGAINCSVVSVMVSRAIGFAKMLDCAMWPRLCDHCSQPARRNTRDKVHKHTNAATRFSQPYSIRTGMREQKERK